MAKTLIELEQELEKEIETIHKNLNLSVYKARNKEDISKRVVDLYKAIADVSYNSIKASELMKDYLSNVSLDPLKHEVYAKYLH